jgi:phage-related protein|nr:MAG TPA: tail tape measure protein [Caudoviricetes sp.]
MASSFGGTVKLTGESEYRKALRDITTNLKEVSSELKLTNTQFSYGDKTVKETKNAYTNMNTTIQEQKEKISSLRSALSEAEKEYGSNNEKVKTFKTQLNNAETQLIQMENATDKSNKGLDELKDGFDDAGQGAIKFGDLLKANVLGDFITSGLKSVAGAVKQVGSALLSVGKDALDSYANYEQLVGGVETLFKDNAGVVEEYASNAYKTAGLSANDYMETVTSFSASLLQSLNGDTKKAAEVSNRAVVDMADNANKMGTDMTSIQNAYQGFAKQNYTMLDNLKLGYGGTKEEMQRLIKDAANMKDVQKELGVTVDANSMSFGNIVNAISVMQKKMDIAGTTSKEASTTIQGSIASLKSAWDNLLTGVADDDADWDNLVSNFFDSIFTAADNVLPRIGTIAFGVMSLIRDTVTELLPEVISMLIDFATTLVDDISGYLPNVMESIGQVGKTILDTFISLLPDILQIGINVLTYLIQGIAESLPNLIPAIVDAVLLMTTTLLDNIDMIIDAGIQLLIGLAEGLINALPNLIDKIPVIIDKLIMAITNNLPKIVESGILLMSKLGLGIVKAIPQLISKIPQIIFSLVRGFANYFSNMHEVGKNLVSGIWEGIKNAKDWLLGKVKEWCGNILNGIKAFFGIHSPSKVFKDEIGTNLALGVGEGFSDTMKTVSNDMSASIPTEFDINSTVTKADTSNQLTLENITKSFVTAVKNLDAQIIIDKDVAGRFVITSVNNKFGEAM